MVLDKEGLQLIKETVERVFTDVEYSYTTLNKVGYKGDMDEGTELLTYIDIMRGIDFPNYQDDFYVSMLTNKDFERIYHRTLVIESNLKRSRL